MYYLVVKISQKTMTWSLVGLIGLPAIGVGLYFLIDNFTGGNSALEQENRIKNSIKTFQSVEKKGTKITEMQNLSIIEYRGDYNLKIQGINRVAGTTTQNYLLGEQGITILKDKLLKRLNFGPEIAMLKGIFLRGDLGSFADGSNGIFFNNTHEIFINMRSILEVYESYDWVTSVGEVIDLEVMTEIIFQIIYHEYHHHMADVYLNSYRENDTRAQLVYAHDVANEDPVDKEPWDKDFYNVFYNTLRYYNANKTNSSDAYAYDGKMIKPLSNVLSLKDLFDRANLSSGKATYPELKQEGPNVAYRPFGKNGFIDFHFAPYDENDLVYYYDIDELFVRKMQQATMTLIDQGEFGFQNDPLDAQNRIILSGSFRSNVEANKYMPTSFTFDVLSYARSVVDPNPYYSDYLFQVANGSENANSDNAKSLYDALTKVMGYQSGDDISLIWWKNEAAINENGQTFEDRTTNMIKVAGYIGDQTKRYFGYYEDATFHAFPITIAPFSYMYKETLISDNRIELEKGKDNFFYVLSDFIDVNLIMNKKLYLANDTQGSNAELIKSINPKASTYYPKIGKLQNASEASLRYNTQGYGEIIVKNV